MDEYSTLVFQTDRNIDIASLANRKLNIDAEDTDAVSEYIFDNLNENGNQVHKKLTTKQAKEYINHAVHQFLEESNIKFNQKLVFGISGGGDSNTLLEAFIANGFPKKNIIPVMILGIPDLDLGVTRARELSDKLGLTLIEISAQQMDEILGRTKNTGTWAEDFENIFSEDLEAIGTFAVRMGLSHVMKQKRAQGIVTGLNLEDILGESILAVMMGELPPKFPMRDIYGTSLYYPLYRIPKKVLDASHPKYSLENYNQRFPNYMHWRSTAYFITQTLASSIPGSEFRLIDGFKKITNAYPNAQQLKYDEDLKIPILHDIDDKTRALWKKFIQN